MNSVHEPGSRTMSKNLTQEKYRVELGQKQVKCTKCTALASPRAQRLGCEPRATLPRPPRACCRLLCAPASPLLPAPVHPCRPPAARSLAARLPYVHLPRAPLAPAAYTPSPAPSLLPCVVSRHNCLSCDTGSPVSYSCTSQYTQVYCNTVPSCLLLLLTIQCSVL